MAKKTNYLTPAQVMEKYPELEEAFGWSAKEIGMFLKSRLLHGYYNHSLRKSMIDEDSLEDLVEYANLIAEKQKAKIIFPVKKSNHSNKM
jgi:hypothetical protein